MKQAYLAGFCAVFAAYAYIFFALPAYAQTSRNFNLPPAADAAASTNNAASAEAGAKPQGRMHLSGGIIVGDDDVPCASGNAGEIVYRDGELRFCDGSSWLVLQHQ